MACENLTLGRLFPCKSVGGIKEIYFINYDEDLFADAISNLNATTDVIEDLTTPVSLWKYEVVGGQSFDEANNTTATSTSWTSTGTIVLENQDAPTRKQLAIMAKSRLHVVTLDYNGDYKIYGLQHGCDVAVNSVSGSVMGDGNSFNLTITSNETSPAHFIDSTAISDSGSDAFDIQ